MKDLTDKIIESAKIHGGKYLLPRRFYGPSYPKTKTDLYYDACEQLVLENKAEWLRGGLAPGIRVYVRD